VSALDGGVGCDIDGYGVDARLQGVVRAVDTATLRGTCLAGETDACSSKAGLDAVSLVADDPVANEAAGVRVGYGPVAFLEIVDLCRNRDARPAFSGVDDVARGISGLGGLEREHGIRPPQAVAVAEGESVLG